MKTLFKKGLCLLVTLCMILSLTAVFTQAAEAADSKPTVFVIGDSTAERNVISSANTENRNGWGQVLYNYFKDTCTVWNWANSGESTRRLYNTWWKSIAGKISAGDYVLIQLGHNDGGRAEVWTDPLAEENAGKADGEYVEGSYKWYLNYYAETIRSKDAYPIFVTSIERQEDAALVESSSRLYNYVNAMKKVGQVENVPVIDVWTDFRALCGEDKLGTEGFANLFISDKIHINRTGAMTTAKIFAENLKKSTHEDAVRLASYLVDDIATVTDAGVPTPQLSEDFNGAYTDGETIGFPMNYWRLEASGTPIKNKTVKYSLQSGNDFAATFTSRKATADEITAYDYNDKVEGDPEKPGTPYTSKMENYLIRHTFEKPVTEGYVKYSFRMKQNAGSDSIAMRVGGFSSDAHYINLSDNRFLPLGGWHTFEFYLDIANKKLVTYADGKVLADTTDATVSALSNVWFGLARTVDANAEITVDDISLTYIDKQTFNDEAGVIPEGYLIKDDFDRINSIPEEWTPAYHKDGRGFKIYTETVNGESNNAVECWSTPNVVDNRTMMTHSFDKQSGYLYLSYRIKNNSETSKNFRLRMGNAEFATIFTTSEICGKYVLGKSAVLPLTNWYTLEYYFDIAKKKFILYVNGAKLLSETENSDLAECDSMSFSYWRDAAGENASVLVDDVILKPISHDEYSSANVLPEGVLISEGFSFGAVDTSFTTTTGGWNGWHASSYGDSSKSTIKFAEDPKDSTNQVVAFNRNIQKLSAFHQLIYDIPKTLTDGCYSVKFNIAPSHENTGVFYFRVSGESTTVSNGYVYSDISFNFSQNTITVPSITYVTNGSYKSNQTITYEFIDDEWCEVEFIFDLTADDTKPVKVSMYINGEEKFSDKYFSNVGKSSFNDGTITSMSFLFPESTAASTDATAVGTNLKLCARVLLDDIIMKELKNEAVSLVKTDDTLSGIKVNAGWKPSTGQKFLVAVYNSENGEITTLKSTEIVTVSARGDNQEIALANPVSVEATDVVKVFYWNMNTLKPISAQFAETIN